MVATQVPLDAVTALVDYFEGATNFYDPTVVEKKVRGEWITAGAPETGFATAIGCH